MLINTVKNVREMCYLWSKVQGRYWVIWHKVFRVPALVMISLVNVISQNN